MPNAITGCEAANSPQITWHMVPLDQHATMWVLTLLALLLVCLLMPVKK